MRYTIAEKVEMVLIYGECHRIMREAVRPSLSVFTNIIKKFQETGTVDNKTRNLAKRATDDGNSINIAAAVIRDPHVSARQLERESGISRQVFYEYYTLTNFTRSTYHFINN